MQARRLIFSSGILILFVVIFILSNSTPLAAAPNPQSNVRGPFTLKSIQVASFDGDVRRLPKPSAPTVERAAPQPRRRSSAPNAPVPTAPRASANSSVATSANTRTPSAIQNFDGLDYYTGGGWIPPDPNGDVGPNHYVQAVNIAIGIYDKTGTQLAAFSYDTLFTGGSAPCSSSNRGDPIALYDAISGHWILSDLAFMDPNNGPFYECIAVSRTADPVSGGWYLYTIDVGGTTTPGVNWFNDYPKLAVWSDGIYMSANMYNAAGTILETVRVFVFNRDDLISGTPPRNAYYDVDGNYSTLLPSNLRGALPPGGTPAFFASIEEPNLLHLWKFQVTNWGTSPPTAIFTGPTNLLVNNFTMPCYQASVQACVPQLGTSQRVDSLGDRLMMQLQYRNLNGVESLWVNHTIAASAVLGYPTGVRWYEIRNPNGTPSVYQQGTFQPDSNYRWMGSLAVDQLGNMALGYSVSSAGMYPAIRYAGRLVTHPLGKLCISEASLIEGTGSQIGTYGYRWGDYSAMTIDPADDLTFWYTNEYFSTTSSVWHTRIGSFKLGNLSSPPGPSSYIYYFPVIAKNIALTCY